MCLSVHVLEADQLCVQDKGIAVCCAFAKKAPTALVKQVAGALVSVLVVLLWLDDRQTLSDQSIMR